MTETNHHENEIDLLVLFSKIWRKINNFILLLINIIINLLNLFFKSIFFIKKKFAILSISIILGGILGFIYQNYYATPIYVTSMTLKPNFKSTIQLYKNIDFYQSLIDQKDYTKLQEQLNIEENEAHSLVEFSVIPYKSESMKLVTYKKLLNLADSTTATHLNFEEYTDKIAIENFSNHIITLKLKNREVPVQLTKSIVESITGNDYYANIQDTYIKNLKIRKASIYESIQRLDSLMFFFKQKTIRESEKESVGTNIYMASNQKESIEIVLFEKYRIFNEQLIQINEDLNSKSNIVNIVSSFNQTGQLKNNFMHLSILIGILGAFLLTFCVLILIEANKILTRNSTFEIQNFVLNK